MTASRMSGPLNVGPQSPTSEPDAVGTVVLCQEYDLDITVETNVSAFRMPGQSSLVDVDVFVTTPSDATVSGTLKVVNGAGDIVTGFDVQGASANDLLSVKNGDAAIASSTRWLDPADDVDTNLSIVYEESGTAATEGVFRIRVYYLQGDGGQD